MSGFTNRPPWAPQKIMPRGATGPIALFNSVCPITGDVIYKHTKENGTETMYLLPNADARERQRQFFLTSVPPVREGEKEVRLSTATERKARRKKEREERTEAREKRLAQEWRS